MLQTKFGWKQASGFRGDVVWTCERTDGRRPDAGRNAITIAHPEHKLRWANKSNETKGSFLNNPMASIKGTNSYNNSKLAVYLYAWYQLLSLHLSSMNICPNHFTQQLKVHGKKKWNTYCSYTLQIINDSMGERRGWTDQLKETIKCLLFISYKFVKGFLAITF